MLTRSIYLFVNYIIKYCISATETSPKPLLHLTIIVPYADEPADILTVEDYTVAVLKMVSHWGTS